MDFANEGLPGINRAHRHQTCSLLHQCRMSGTYFNHLQTKGYNTMKHMLMAIMAVAVAVTFSAPAFAEGPKEGGKDKKPGQAVETIYGDEKK
jgi:hypothetical protein